ncbi:MAG: accessory Sec system protein Asp2 [Lachnospiraceae bacterium]|nr:accessory Sec system protein Asp2 [Lachnospiraceae bacterium]
MNRIRVLQLGDEDWSKEYAIPEQVDWFFLEEGDEPGDQPFELVLIDRIPRKKEMDSLKPVTQCYRLYVTTQVGLRGLLAAFFEEKKGKRLETENISQFLATELRNFFPESYGEKFRHKNLTVSRAFSGTIRWDGDYCLTLQGDYGETFSQIAYWRNTIPLFRGQAIDFWLEYKKDPQVAIQLEITQFVGGSISGVQNRWTFSEEDMQDVVTIDNPLPEGPIFVSLSAKGSGILRIIALHDRYSRRGYGHFLPGGERYVTSKREEVFCYFEPGNRKPPFNVYFAGYKTMQGFEGLNMMRQLGCPFLLIAEPRLEGGCFYLGSDEYEEMVRGMIRSHMEELGFTSEQTIFSGLSMGTFGAFYYGCDFTPHAILVGKPLTSIGNIAANEKYLRAGGFPTSLDVLHYLSGDLDAEAISKANARYWDRFDKTDWSNTKFIVAYMIEDDYDATAYQDLIDHMHSSGATLYGKGIHGRHNDDTTAVVQWFRDQYKEMIYEDFRRGL